VTARRLQIASSVATLGLILLWPLWPEAMALGIVYFGLAAVVPAGIVASWISRPKDIPLWRSSVYRIALLATGMLFLFSAVVWALLVTKSVEPHTTTSQMLVRTALALNLAAFVGSFFGKGWNRLAMATLSFGCFIVWSFPFALD